ncbi:sensor histidine kinase [Paenibacillus sp. SYP-B4298]|uniref:sensor histidine kinase n=1 Tax=Paenibacillus sp. SYP-B4298 TaxID=2996034 RepID=UPI0022DDFE78|nr:histidine kinase [Paenibacillus sp. SYP-B4298]
MRRRNLLPMNTFAKVTLMIIFIVALIIMLYSYSHRVSLQVVEQAVEQGQSNRLAFVMSQLEMTVGQLAKFAVVAGSDDSIRDYLYERERSTPLQRVERQTRITDMLNMQVSTSSWDNQIVLFIKDAQEALSTDYSVMYNSDYVARTPKQRWQLQEADGQLSYFSWMRESLYDPQLVVEVRFASQNMINMLDHLKQGSTGEPFLYFPGAAPLANSSADKAAVAGAAAGLNRLELGKQGSHTFSWDSRKYVINYIRSDSLGWYLVDFTRLDEVYSPITLSRNVFYLSVGLLLALILLLMLILYRNVQRPISLLLQGVRRISHGNYATRLEQQAGHEFSYLFNSFNKMAEQIEELIEKVYKETLRSKEATLKQLQSQINPHFLYNCLFYIKNMASLGDKEAVIAMSLSLGEYYRYTTRLERSTAPLSEEIRLLDNYLQIQTLRLQRLTYEIEVPNEMLELEMPRLLLQPVVENAVIHGVESSLEFAIIHIWGERNGRAYRLVIDNKGAGVPQAVIAELQRRMSVEPAEHHGFGLWNIHQRLIHRYGEGAGLRFSESPLGGLRVELLWEEDTMTDASQGDKDDNG